MPTESALVAEITVAEIVPPQISQKGKLMPARVKDTEGRVWNVWKDKFEVMGIAVGKSYAAMYTTRTSLNPVTGQPKADNTIVGLNPMQGALPMDKAEQKAQAYEDRTEDIAVQGISHCPEIAAAAADGDVARGVKILRTLRLIWREYKKQSVISPSGDVDDALDDGIPY